MQWFFKACGGEVTLGGSVFEGWNIGAVSVKRVRLDRGGALDAEIRRHGGDPEGTIRSMLGHCGAS